MILWIAGAVYVTLALAIVLGIARAARDSDIILLDHEAMLHARRLDRSWPGTSEPSSAPAPRVEETAASVPALSD